MEWKRYGTRLSPVLAVLALCALLCILVQASAFAAAATGPRAVSAKKKCKKAKRASTAARRRCGKKKRAAVQPPAAAPLPLGPVLRAEITWTGDADLDLHAWDENSNHIGWNQDDYDFDVWIPGMAYESADDRESIWDDRNPSTRDLSYGVCYYPDYDPNPQPVSGTLFIRGQTGPGMTVPMTIKVGDPWIVISFSGGRYDGNENWCPSA